MQHVCVFPEVRVKEVWASVSERRVNAPEGKPPAEEQRALGPEEMKEQGFDNFLQSPSER